MVARTAVVIMTTFGAVQTFGVVEPQVDTWWFAVIGSLLPVIAGLASTGVRR